MGSSYTKNMHSRDVDIEQIMNDIRTMTHWLKHMCNELEQTRSSVNELNQKVSILYESKK
jgi:hypothetical protein